MLNQNLKIMAVTNFFAHAAAINFEGCLNITLKKDGEQLTVSVLLLNDACADNAKAHIPPLILKGTAKELCEGFFDAVAEPLAQTSALLVNMEQYLRGQEKAKQDAASQKKKTEKAVHPEKQIPEEIKQMQYAGVMDKVEALEKEGKFKEAWMKIPQPSEFPDKAEEIRNRRAAISAKFSPDLFGAEQPAEPIDKVEPNTTDDVTDHSNAESLSHEGQG
jgi:PRTRC genetic system protein E